MIKHRLGKILPFVSAAAACLSVFSCTTTITPNAQISYAKLNINAPAVTYINGLWYTENHSKAPLASGKERLASASSLFNHKEVYTENGIFVSDPPENAITIDLKGLYVLPPFGKTHNHPVDAQGTVNTANSYLREGVFYYKTLNYLASGTTEYRPYWARPNTLDVSFSNGGISMTGDNPDKLYQRLAKDSNMSASEHLEDAFFTAPTVEALHEQWPTILKGKPDFIKLYLLRHDADSRDGLPEAVFREAIKLAKDAKLRTTVHLESIADLRVAINAGANEFVHLHSRKKDTALDSDGLIPDELIDEIVRQKFVTVTTTRATAVQYANQPVLLETIQNVQRKNLRRLFDAGAPIAIGSDSVAETLKSEVDTLRSLGVFNDQELLRLMIDTPRVGIFPKRAISRFKVGYETSFIALRCNPFEDFSCTQKISQRVKQGLDLNAIIAE